MLQTKIFLSNGSDVYDVENQFNAWVFENPNVNIKDVKFQHTATNCDDYVVQSGSIMVMFEVPEGSEPYSRFKWNSVWNRRAYFKSSFGKNDFVANALRENPNFPIVGELPREIVPVLVKLGDKSYRITKRGFNEELGHYFEGIEDEHFSWQYLPE